MEPQAAVSSWQETKQQTKAYWDIKVVTPGQDTNF
jgi:hypothetical protein